MYRPYLVGKMGSPAMSSGSRYETDQIALSRYADFHSVSISDHSHRNLCAGLAIDACGSPVCRELPFVEIKLFKGSFLLKLSIIRVSAFCVVVQWRWRLESPVV